jgi:hypothetical protein
LIFFSFFFSISLLPVRIRMTRMGAGLTLLGRAQLHLPWHAIHALCLGDGSGTPVRATTSLGAWDSVLDIGQCLDLDLDLIAASCLWLLSLLPRAPH